MPYVTSVERIAKAEGGAAVLLRQFARRWVTCPTNSSSRSNACR